MTIHRHLACAIVTALVIADEPAFVVLVRLNTDLCFELRDERPSGEELATVGVAAFDPVWCADVGGVAETFEGGLFAADTAAE